MRAAVESWLAAHCRMVLACSALKARYCETLLADSNDMKVVYLKGSYEQIANRLADSDQVLLLTITVRWAFWCFVGCFDRAGCVGDCFQVNHRWFAN